MKTHPGPSFMTPIMLFISIQDEKIDHCKHSHLMRTHLQRKKLSWLTLNSFLNALCVHVTPFHERWNAKVANGLVGAICAHVIVVFLLWPWKTVASNCWPDLGIGKRHQVLSAMLSCNALFFVCGRVLSGEFLMASMAKWEGNQDNSGCPFCSAVLRPTWEKKRVISWMFSCQMRSVNLLSILWV